MIIPANGGTETPFRTRSGVRLLYVWDTETGEHHYMNADTDIVLDDEEAFRYLDPTMYRSDM